MDFHRFVWLAAVGLMLSPLAALAKPTTVTAEVNLREQPTTASTALALIPKGDSVDVASCTDGWCKVSYSDKQGYVISRNLGVPQPRTAVRRRPQVYAAEPFIVAPGPIYVGPPLGYYGGYYGYYRPRWGYGWRGGYGYGWRGGWRRW